MSEKQIFSFRLSKTTITQIDSLITEVYSKKFPFELNRSDIVRMAINELYKNEKKS